MIDLPTITELRARGENQRFLDDLGYIIDGLQAESIEVKRPRSVHPHPHQRRRTTRELTLATTRVHTFPSSAVDLVRRLLDADFRRSVKTLDEAENVYTILREAGAGDGDTVSDLSTLSFACGWSTDCRLNPHPRRFWTQRLLCSSRFSLRTSEAWSRSSADEGRIALRSSARCCEVARTGSHSSERHHAARSSGVRIARLSIW